MEKYRLSISSTFNGLYLGFISYLDTVEPLLMDFAKAFKLEANLYFKKDNDYFELSDPSKEGAGTFRVIAVYDFTSDRITANRIRKALFYFMLINGFKDEENVKHPFN